MNSENTNAFQLQREWSHLLNQSVSRIQHCVGQLSRDQLWWKPAVELNSIGALIRYLCGNLNHWVVAGIPQAQNSRDRTAEFESSEQEPVAELLTRLQLGVDYQFHWDADAERGQVPL